MGPCAVARANLFATPSLGGVAWLRGAGHGGDASGCSSLSTQRRCQLSNDKSNDKNPEGRLDVRADQPAPFAAHSHAHSLRGGAAAERGVLGFGERHGCVRLKRDWSAESGHSTVYGYPRANSCVSQTSTIEGRVGRRVGGGLERPACETYGLGYTWGRSPRLSVGAWVHGDAHPGCCGWVKLNNHVLPCHVCVSA